MIPADRPGRSIDPVGHGKFGTARIEGFVELVRNRQKRQRLGPLPLEAARRGRRRMYIGESRLGAIGDDTGVWMSDVSLRFSSAGALGFEASPHDCNINSINAIGNSSLFILKNLNSLIYFANVHDYF